MVQFVGDLLKELRKLDGETIIPNDSIAMVASQLFGTGALSFVSDHISVLCSDANTFGLRANRIYTKDECLNYSFVQPFI